MDTVGSRVGTVQECTVVLNTVLGNLKWVQDRNRGFGKTSSVECSTIEIIMGQIKRV